MVITAEPFCAAASRSLNAQPFLLRARGGSVLFVIFLGDCVEVLVGLEGLGRKRLSRSHAITGDGYVRAVL